MQYGQKRFDLTLQPVTGKALPVYKGEVLRITLPEGEQCVDFNAFNLHDYKEYMSVGHTRQRHGFRPGKGDFIWSVHSRNRPMYYILEMPGTCVTDVMGARCHQGIYSKEYGPHTNCNDTFTQAEAEYGLSADDVHDSFNMWMNTEWDSLGRWYIVMNTGRPGDYVDLLAMFDTLAVPIVCGSGDIRPTSNYRLKPIQVEVFEPSDETQALVEDLNRPHAPYARTLADLAIKDIKTERELKPVPGFEPKWINFPLVERTIQVPLSQAEHRALQVLKRRGLGKTDGEVLRAAFFYWNSYTRFRIPLPVVGNMRVD
jgi:uncharacterized protein YcgI (DUF1989 family)